MHGLFHRDFGEALLAYWPPNSRLIGSHFFRCTITGDVLHQFSSAGYFDEKLWYGGQSQQDAGIEGAQCPGSKDRLLAR
jgi:hypothetical protein